MAASFDIALGDAVTMRNVLQNCTTPVDFETVGNGRIQAVSAVVIVLLSLRHVIASLHPSICSLFAELCENMLKRLFSPSIPSLSSLRMTVTFLQKACPLGLKSLYSS